MSSICFSNNFEMPENYIPGFFFDYKDQIAQRVFTHIPCGKSASYDVFVKARDSNGFNCQRCDSKINSIFLNKRLSEAILDFKNNFYSRNELGAENSYKLALLLNKEEQFKYVVLICKRALKFIEIDEINKQNLRVLLNNALDRRFQIDFAIKTNLDNIEHLTDELIDYEKKTKITNDQHEIEILNNYIVSNLSSLACEKIKIARIYLECNMIKEASNRYQNSIYFYEKALNVQPLIFYDKSPILENLISNLIDLGDLYFSSNIFNEAAKQYEKSINFLKQSIETFKEKSEQLQSRLDEVFFKLSKSYSSFADNLFIKNEYSTAKEYYDKAQTSLANIKEKNDSTEILSKSISEKLDIINLILSN